jgi:KDO2-lipid IV(A) lauroyltransferase
MRIIAMLPFKWQLAIGKQIGNLLRHIARSRRRIAEINIRLCFPTLNQSDQTALLKAHFAALGTGLCETAMAWWATDKKLRALTEIEGVEHLKRAVGCSSNGVILLTGHFTTMELAARFITWYQPFHAMYRSHKNQLYESFMYSKRWDRSKLPPLPHKDVRGLLRALREGQTVWYAPDQDHGLRNSIFTSFYGVTACTVTATSRLAKMSGAAVVPYFPMRLPGEIGYKVIILPALTYFPSNDIKADTRRINEMLENYICQTPEQYLWVHRRFKTQPCGCPNLYNL